MDAITSYMSRRKGLKDAVSLNRDQRSLQRRAGSIGGVRNVGTDSAGRRVVMPTSAQISGGTAPPAFYRSMAPTRADRVRSAMADGSFGGIRSKFNESQAGKQVMDPDGTIRAHNPYRDGGQLGGSETVTPPAPGVPAAPTQPTPPAPVAAKPVQQPAGPPAPGSRPGESLARTGVIRDETGDITNRIRSSMAGGQATPTAPAKPDATVKAAQSLQAAGAGIKNTETLIADTQRLINKTSAPQTATTTPAAPMPGKTAQATTPTQASKSPAPTAPRSVDPSLTDSRGFDKPDNTAPGNVEFRPLPDKDANNIRAIAGRGDDGVSRALQVVNPLRTFSTLKQGGKSDLPAVMGPQPEYPNANDRLKGDSDAIKTARDQGAIRTRKVTDRFGESKTQVAVPMVRGTNTPASEFFKARAKKAILK